MPSKGKQYRFSIPHRPKAKERPRFSMKGGYAYTSAKTRTFEDLVKTYYKGPKFEGPVSLALTFSPTRVTVCVTEMPDTEPSKLRGDVDNYVKSVSDALNGLAYDDDKQIHKLSGRKQ
jgi:Holliday junction resolvase RusA-like endonuclease